MVKLTKNHILTKETIKEELTKILENYEVNDPVIKHEHNDNIQVSFTNNKGEKAFLFSHFDSLELLKITVNTLEKVTINDNLLMFHKKLAKNANGLIYTDLIKYYTKSNTSSKNILVDLKERTYLFKKKTLEMILPNIDLRDITPLELLTKIENEEIDLINCSDFSIDFVTYFSYYLSWYLKKEGKKLGRTVNTYINGKDVSLEYDLPSKPIQKINDIYNLYKENFPIELDTLTKESYSKTLKK